MQIEIDPRLADEIRGHVDRGRYPTVDEVLREALQLLAERDQLAELRASLIEADAQIDRGEYFVWSPELLEAWEREVDERLGQEEVASSNGRP